MVARKSKAEAAAVEEIATDAVVEEAVADEPTSRRRIDIDALEIHGVEDAESVVRVRKGRRAGLPEDHPISVAFAESWSENKAKTIRTSSPEDVARLVVARANSYGLGVDKSVGEDSVTFLVRERRSRGVPAGVEERTEES